MITPSGCHEWTGSTDSNGYGQMRVNGRLELVHRLAFLEANGFWPNVCRHTCDNGACINPEHLQDGTQAENMNDMAARGRASRMHSPETVERVRALRLDGLKYREITDETGVSQAQISRIMNGKQRKYS